LPSSTGFQRRATRCTDSRSAVYPPTSRATELRLVPADEESLAGASVLTSDHGRARSNERQRDRFPNASPTAGNAKCFRLTTQRPAAAA
jgi:hypothetical protein